MALGNSRQVKKAKRMHRHRMREPGKEEVSGQMKRLMAKTWKVNFTTRKNKEQKILRKCAKSLEVYWFIINHP